ncbi:head GIN domain-containing protein [Pirellulaceae bacterium SH449]
MNRLIQYFPVYATLLAVSGCSVAITGSGVSQSEARDLDEFRSIRNTTVGEVMITIGDNQTVEVTADDNILPLVVTEVVDGELIIKSTGNFSTSLGLLVNITTPMVESVSSAGVGNTKLLGIDSDKLNVRLSGVGSIQAEGSVKNLNVSVTGVGGVNFSKLIAENVSVKVSGVGSAVVHASQSINASTTGVGSIRVAGNPEEKTVKKTGVGSISFVEQ